VPKKILLWTVVIFAVFYLITQPESAASAVRTAVAWVGDAFASIATFLSSLFA
jgi:hypothetical protein